MESLIIPAAVLVMLGLWAAFSNGRKFRLEFRRRGMAWDAACAALERGEGVIVIDTVWGPQRGLGHPTLWWLPEVADGAELAGHIESTDQGKARLVRSPRSMRQLEVLRGRFGEERVRTHGWAVSGDLLGAPRS